jgi:hypothetical protein
VSGVGEVSDLRRRLQNAHVRGTQYKRKLNEWRDRYHRLLAHIDGELPEECRKSHMRVPKDHEHRLCYLEREVRRLRSNRARDRKREEPAEFVKELQRDRERNATWKRRAEQWKQRALEAEGALRSSPGSFSGYRR